MSDHTIYPRARVDGEPILSRRSRQGKRTSLARRSSETLKDSKTLQPRSKPYNFLGKALILASCGKWARRVQYRVHEEGLDYGGPSFSSSLTQRSEKNRTFVLGVGCLSMGITHNIDSVGRTACESS